MCEYGLVSSIFNHVYDVVRKTCKPASDTIRSLFHTKPNANSLALVPYIGPKNSVSSTYPSMKFSRLPKRTRRQNATLTQSNPLRVQ